MEAALKGHGFSRAAKAAISKGALAPTRWVSELTMQPRFHSGRRFEIIRSGKLQAGQMTIVYECLQKLGKASLAELAQRCKARGYTDTFKSETDIERSILYHLKRMEEGTLGRAKRYQDPLIRELK
jgi:hypothetical protein